MNPWIECEQRKADLKKHNLTNKEYQEEIKRLAAELGV